MKKTELNGYVYDFSVNYGGIPFGFTQSIHKYLILKNSMIENMTV